MGPGRMRAHAGTGDSARTSAEAGRAAPAANRPRKAVKRAAVRESILALIADYRGGEALPSERDLCERLSVSRPTLRAAVDQLTEEGVLTRQQGRGTFTTPRKIAQP